MKIPILKNKDFLLRPFKKGDEESIVRHINNKEIVYNLLVLPYPYKMKDAREWVDLNLKMLREKNPEKASFAIEIKGKVVGGIALNSLKIGHKSELGYWLGKEYWGRGVITSAIKMVTQYGFQELDLIRIYARVFPWNKGSMRVLEKNNFRLEGVLKKDAKKGNKCIDCHLFSKTR